MSHEKLRFNIILSDSKKDKEVTTNSSFDPIYSDTVYNTHFSIFADFLGSFDGKKFNLRKINFLIQNYLGSVSIGISKIVGFEISIAQERDLIPNFSTGRHIKLYIILQGLSNKFEDNFPDSKEQLDNFYFLEGDMLEVIPLFEPVDNSLSKINEDATTRNEEIIFSDSEYTKRDGEDIRLLDNYRDKLDLINRLKSVKKPEQIPFALQSSSGKSIDEKNRVDIFGGLGGGYFCKLKISDIFIR